jgi:hypothetical protein
MQTENRLREHENDKEESVRSLEFLACSLSSKSCSSTHSYQKCVQSLCIVRMRARTRVRV